MPQHSLSAESGHATTAMLEHMWVCTLSLNLIFFIYLFQWNKSECRIWHIKLCTQRICIVGSIIKVSMCLSAIRLLCNLSSHIYNIYWTDVHIMTAKQITNSAYASLHTYTNTQTHKHKHTNTNTYTYSRNINNKIQWPYWVITITVV